MVYFDYSATTKPSKESLHRLLETSQEGFANPSSLHALGVKAEGILTSARVEIAREIGAKKEEIIFTSSGTEANNLALLGSIHRKGNIIISKGEHPSVYETAKHFEAEGFEVIEIPSPQGVLDLERLERELTGETRLISCMLVGNETGAVNPVKEIAALRSEKAPRALFHVDAVQAFGKIPFDVNTLGADLITLSAHKLYAPRGAGALYIRKGTTLTPILYGGGQERGLRSGTENVAAIAAFAVAVKEAKQQMPENFGKVQALYAKLEAGLIKLPHIHLHRPPKALPHIVCISVPGYQSETMIHYLEKREIYLSAGSACNSKKSTYSRALADMGLNEKELTGALRISLSHQNEEEEIATLLRALAELPDQITGKRN